MIKCTRCICFLVHFSEFSLTVIFFLMSACNPLLLNPSLKSCNLIPVLGPSTGLGPTFCFRNILNFGYAFHSIEFKPELLHPLSHILSPPDHHSWFDPIRNLPQKQRLKHQGDPQAKTTIKDVRMLAFTSFPPLVVFTFCLLNQHIIVDSNVVPLHYSDTCVISSKVTSILLASKVLIVVL